MGLQAEGKRVEVGVDAGDSPVWVWQRLVAAGATPAPACSMPPAWGGAPPPGATPGAVARSSGPRRQVQG